MQKITRLFGAGAIGLGLALGGCKSVPVQLPVIESPASEAPVKEKVPFKIIPEEKEPVSAKANFNMPAALAGRYMHYTAITSQRPTLSADGYMEAYPFSSQEIATGKSFLTQYLVTNHVPEDIAQGVALECITALHYKKFTRLTDAEVAAYKAEEAQLYKESKIPQLRECVAGVFNITLDAVRKRKMPAEFLPQAARDIINRDMDNMNR